MDKLYQYIQKNPYKGDIKTMEILVSEWTKIVMNNTNYNMMICDYDGKKYISLILDQTKDFVNWIINKLDSKNMNVRDLVIFFQLMPIDEENSISDALKCFSDDEASEILPHPASNPNLTPSSYWKSREFNEFSAKFTKISESVTGNAYHADLLIGMYDLKNMKDVSMLSRMQILIAEVSSMRHIKQIHAITSMLCKTKLNSILTQTFNPLRNIVHCLLGIKYDSGCTLSVLPRDIVKIVMLLSF
jgi:hypothetical protein